MVYFFILLLLTDSCHIRFVFCSFYRIDSWLFFNMPIFAIELEGLNDLPDNCDYCYAYSESIILMECVALSHHHEFKNS
jgi:hypothetical protein